MKSNDYPSYLGAVKEFRATYWRNPVGMIATFSLRYNGFVKPVGTQSGDDFERRKGGLLNDWK